MSVPSIIFLDTNILDEQNFNFSSVAISSFIEAVKGRAITYLLPNPIEREIKRHITERSEEAIKALDQARHRAPLLAKWKSWPAKGNHVLLRKELVTIARNEWEGFLKRFRVERLDYSEVDLNTIMGWYDNCRAPFGTGGKRKEFPDAFAILSVLRYAERMKAAIAVVSRDEGMKAACEATKDLLHFSSLPGLTEALLSSDDRIERLKKLFDSAKVILGKAVVKTFPTLDFEINEEAEGEVQDVRINSVSFPDLHIVGLGETACTVSFKSTVHFSADVGYEELYIEGTVSQTNTISGVAKLRINKSWDRIEDITLFEIDDSYIDLDAPPDELS